MGLDIVVSTPRQSKPILAQIYRLGRSGSLLKRWLRATRWAGLHGGGRVHEPKIEVLHSSSSRWVFMDYLINASCQDGGRLITRGEP